MLASRLVNAIGLALSACSASTVVAPADATARGVAVVGSSNTIMQCPTPKALRKRAANSRAKTWSPRCGAASSTNSRSARSRAQASCHHAVLSLTRPRKAISTSAVAVAVTSAPPSTMPATSTGTPGGPTVVTSATMPLTSMAKTTNTSAPVCRKSTEAKMASAVIARSAG
jgi:hypothetical protein